MRKSTPRSESCINKLTRWPEKIAVVVAPPVQAVAAVGWEEARYGRVGNWKIGFCQDLKIFVLDKWEMICREDIAA